VRTLISRYWARFFNAFFLEGGVFYFIFVVLLLPMIWYALRTRFALIDDYNSWYGVTWIYPPHNLLDIPANLLFSENNRFRPGFHLYNLLTWFLLGQNYSLHHALRIGLKLLTGWFFWRMIRTWTPKTPAAVHLPSLVFWAVFLFFPNNPEARLAPQETLVTVTLAWLLWGFTRLVWKYQGDLFACRRLYVELLLAFVFFTGSKELAIPQSAVTILFLCWISLRKPNRLFGVLPFIAVLILPILRSLAIYNGKTYSANSFTLDPVAKNLFFMLKHMTFFTAQPLFGIIFAVVAVWVIWRILKSVRALRLGKAFKQFVLSPCARPEYYRLVLGILVGLQFAASFLIALLSWRIALRYMYIPMILWILIVALAVELPSGLPLKTRPWITRAVVVLCFLFIFTNYYNFIYQFADQYYTRANEALVLKDVRIRLERGDTVYVVLETEFQYKIRDYFHFFLPFYEKVEFPTLHFVDFAQLNEGGIYYLTLRNTPLAGHVLERQYLVSAPSDSLLLFKQFSQVFNFGREPFVEVDDGVLKIGTINWYLYRNSLP
jgi:hypothetical protein